MSQLDLCDVIYEFYVLVMFFNEYFKIDWGLFYFIKYSTLQSTCFLYIPQYPDDSVA